MGEEGGWRELSGASGKGSSSCFRSKPPMAMFPGLGGPVRRWLTEGRNGNRRSLCPEGEGRCPGFILARYRVRMGPVTSDQLHTFFTKKTNRMLSDVSGGPASALGGLVAGGGGWLC